MFWSYLEDKTFVWECISKNLRPQRNAVNVVKPLRDMKWIIVQYWTKTTLVYLLFVHDKCKIFF